jgi:hypothetical protein
MTLKKWLFFVGTRIDILRKYIKLENGIPHKDVI